MVLGTHTLSLSILQPSHPQPSHSHLCPHTPSPTSRTAMRHSWWSYTKPKLATPRHRPAGCQAWTCHTNPVCRTSEYYVITRCMRASVYVCMLAGMWKFCLRSQLCPRGIVSVLLPPTNSEQLGEGPGMRLGTRSIIHHPPTLHPSHSHLSPSRPLTHTHQPENYEAQLVELHKAKAGYTPAQAESEFLQVAKDLPRYGMHLFAAQVSTKRTTCITIFIDCDVH